MDKDGSPERAGETHYDYFHIVSITYRDIQALWADLIGLPWDRTYLLQNV